MEKIHQRKFALTYNLNHYQSFGSCQGLMRTPLDRNEQPLLVYLLQANALKVCTEPKEQGSYMMLEEGNKFIHLDKSLNTFFIKIFAHQASSTLELLYERKLFNTVLGQQKQLQATAIQSCQVSILGYTLDNKQIDFLKLILRGIPTIHKEAVYIKQNWHISYKQGHIIQIFLYIELPKQYVVGLLLLQ